MESLRRRKIFGPPPKANRTSPEPLPNLQESEDEKKKKTPSTVRKTKLRARNLFRSSAEFLVLFASLVYLVWIIYKTHNYSLPKPNDGEGPKDRFSEFRAEMSMAVLSSLGAREFSSMILEYAASDTKMLLTNIKNHDVPKSVDMEMEWQTAKSGWIPFEGKTLIFDSLRNLVVRISPKGKLEAKENAILVSSHIDSIKFTVGAGDCLSNIVTMIELIRNMVQIADQFKNSIIFLFNTGEEEGLMGAHAFMKQHRWVGTIRTFVNLEAMGVGGPSVIFQAYPSGWLAKEFCKVAPYPATAIIAQDIFRAGVIGSMTDFQVYHKEGNLSGLDFVFTENAGVYHTQFDLVPLIRKGSMQHLGDNLNALLRSVAKSPELANQIPGSYSSSRNEVIYFDVLGKFMFVASASGAQIAYLILASQAFLFLAPIVVGPKTGQPVAFFLTLFTIFLTLFFGLLFPFLVGYILPFLCVNPIPYLAHMELIFGLFGAPAFSGALVGQMIGRRFLYSHLRKKGEEKEREEREREEKARKGKEKKTQETSEKTVQKSDREEVEKKGETVNSVDGEKENGLMSSSGETGEGEGGGGGGGGGGGYESLQQIYEKKLEKEYVIEWETERWLFVGGLVLWLILMLVTASLRLGTAFFAFVWLLFPALSYGVLQASKIGDPPSCGLKISTFLSGVLIPILFSSNLFLRIPAVLVSMMGRIDKNPGSVEPWQANGVIAIMVGLILVITVIYLLPLAHRGGGAPILLFLSLSLSFVSILIAALEGVPAFSKTAPKEIVAVSLYPDLNELEGQRVDWRQLSNASRDDLPVGVLSIASFTPGNFSKDAKKVEGLECSSLDVPDFVTFHAKYACSAAIKLPSNIGVKLDGYHYLHSLENSVTELEVLSDKGRNSVGADKWREGIEWWGGKVRGNDVEDEWEEWREEKGKQGQEIKEVGNVRMTRVGIKTGLSRRWNLAVDATRIRAFSIGVVNGTFRKYAFRKIEPEEKWHQIAVRVRYNYYSWVNKFIIKLYWRRYVRKEGNNRPLLRIRSDIQEGYVSETDDTINGVLRQLPPFVVQFGKSSLPTNQAFVDVLYLD